MTIKQATAMARIRINRKSTKTRKQKWEKTSSSEKLSRLQPRGSGHG